MPTPPKHHRPGRGITIAGAMMLAASIGLAIGGVALGVQTIKQNGKSFQKLAHSECPGSRIVTLRAGSQNVYADLPQENGNLPDAEVRISNARTGAEIPVTRVRGRSGFRAGDIRGRIIGTVTIPASDQYLIEASGENAEYVSVGHYSGTGMVLGVLSFIGGIGVGILLFLGGLPLLLVGIVQLRKSSRDEP